jgi:hypothetical protein
VAAAASAASLLARASVTSVVLPAAVCKDLADIIVAYSCCVDIFNKAIQQFQLAGGFN